MDEKERISLESPAKTGSTTVVEAVGKREKKRQRLSLRLRRRGAAKMSNLAALI